MEKAKVIVKTKLCGSSQPKQLKKAVRRPNSEPDPREIPAKNRNQSTASTSGFRATTSSTKLDSPEPSVDSTSSNRDQSITSHVGSHNLIEHTGINVVIFYY
jgi:hypothetical protein